jgi:hypothetical protein
VIVRLSAAPAAGVALAAVRTYFEAAAGLTVSASGAGVVREASVAATLAAPALKALRTPFLAVATVATPAVKVSAVALPKATAVPELLATVGALPAGLDEAPLKTRLWEPV